MKTEHINTGKNILIQTKTTVATLVSVIIPYRDAEQWIVRCVKSLMRQEGRFEFIFIDDHSRDRSQELVENFADDRFMLLNNEHSVGVSGARNTGLDHASGKWITFLDADDEMLEDAYIKFINMIGGWNVIQFNHLRYYAEIEKEVMKYDNGEGIYGVNSPPKCWWGVWNKLYRADFIRDIRFNESLQYGEDGLFNIECFEKGTPIYHAPREVVTVRHRFDNKQSLSHRKTKADIVRQSEEYGRMLLRSKDRQLCLMMCDELSRLWGLNFKRVFEEVNE